MRGLKKYLRLSEKRPGWTRGPEAEALANASFSLPENAVIVEIGSFFGSGTILLAGPRQLRRSGMVHAVDPFDGSGDSFSIPYYDEIIAAHQGRPLRELFDESLRLAELSDWVEVHQARAPEIGASWTTPIDLLFLDGDQSPIGARAAYEAFERWLKPGAVIALHNSNPREYHPEHEGHRRLVLEEILPPRYTDIKLITSTTFARNTA